MTRRISCVCFRENIATDITRFVITNEFPMSSSSAFHDKRVEDVLESPWLGRLSASSADLANKTRHHSYTVNSRSEKTILSSLHMGTACYPCLRYQSCFEFTRSYFLTLAITAIHKLALHWIQPCTSIICCRFRTVFLSRQRRSVYPRRNLS